MKKLQKIKEDDFLQYYNDLMSGKAGNIPPDALAPTPQEGSEDGYDEDKDPEHNEALKEKLSSKWLPKRIREANAVEMLGQWARTIDDPQDLTPENFQQATGKAINPTKWDQYLKHGIQRFAPEKLGLLGAATGQGVKRNKDSQYYVGGQQAEKKKAPKSGPYERDENFKPTQEQSAALEKYANQVDENGGSRVSDLFEDIGIAIERVIRLAGTVNKDKGDNIRHLCVCGDPGIGKTYTVMERFAPDHDVDQHNEQPVQGSPTGAKLWYESGQLGSVMTNVVAFFYKHSENEIIALDDNDQMIKNDLEQDLMNMMKAILDPSAGYKPISVKPNMLKKFAIGFEGLHGNSDPQAAKVEKEMRMSKAKEGTEIQIDREALKENQLRISVNGEQVVNKRLTTREANEWLSKCQPSSESKIRKPLKEHTNPNKPYLSFLDKIYEAEDDDYFDEDDELIDDEPAPKKGKEKKAKKSKKGGGGEDDYEPTYEFPPKFYFNSGVIFLSNLEMFQINKAVKDRCRVIEVKLSLSEFMDRLTSSFDGVYKGHGDLGEWSKKNAYTALGICIAAYNTGKPLNGQAVQINQKLTFRFFTSMVELWEDFTETMTEKTGLDFKKPNQRAKLQQEMLNPFMRRYMIPTLKLKEEKEK